MRLIIFPSFYTFVIFINMHLNLHEKDSLPVIRRTSSSLLYKRPSQSSGIENLGKKIAFFRKRRSMAVNR